MKKNHDLQVKIAAGLILVGIFLACLGIRYLILRYAPCSFFVVADAPVRCLK